MTYENRRQALTDAQALFPDSMMEDILAAAAFLLNEEYSVEEEKDESAVETLEDIARLGIGTILLDDDDDEVTLTEDGWTLSWAPGTFLTDERLTSMIDKANVIGLRVFHRVDREPTL